jgi:3-oxoacyl-[acyl-carrier-protein] synthase II
MQGSNVVVTGVGMVTPLGETAGESARAWLEGGASVWRALPELADTPLSGVQAAVLPPLDAGLRLGSRRMLKYMSGAAVLGCVAAREALLDAAAKERFAPECIGLYAGTGLTAASIDDIQRMLDESVEEGEGLSIQRLGAKGLAAASPLVSFKILTNMPPCLISIIEGIRGPNLILTPWEGQTGAVLLEAWKAVRSGAVDCALAGAADTPAHPSTILYLRHAGILSTEERPASGAAYVVMERAESALRAGRAIYARVEAVSLSGGGRAVSDPLAVRLGRTFAAAPAIALALGCLGEKGEVSVTGVDGQRFEARLEPAA